MRSGLSEDLLRAAGETKGLGLLLNALLLLAALAALTDRTPVAPSVPCLSRWLKRHGMTPNGIADDYILQFPPEAGAATLPIQLPPQTGAMLAEREHPPGVRCHVAIGGARCAFPNVLPAWQPLGGTSLLAEHLPATSLGICANSSSGGGGDAAAWAGWAGVEELRARAERHRAAPMLEIRSSDLLHRGSAGSSILQSFRCGLPVTVLDEEALVDDERRRLRLLQKACPAFFAARGTTRRKLDWLHRRRVIRSPEAECAAAA